MLEPGFRQKWKQDCIPPEVGYLYVSVCRLWCQPTPSGYKRKSCSSCEGITYIHTYIIPGKSRTYVKDDAPYLADKNTSKYRARFVIFEEKPF
jgi:hypothetical protein